MHNRCIKKNLPLSPSLSSSLSSTPSLPYLSPSFPSSLSPPSSLQDLNLSTYYDSAFLVRSAIMVCPSFKGTLEYRWGLLLHDQIIQITKLIHASQTCWIYTNLRTASLFLSTFHHKTFCVTEHSSALIYYKGTFFHSFIPL